MSKRIERGLKQKGTDATFQAAEGSWRIQRTPASSFGEREEDTLLKDLEIGVFYWVLWVLDPDDKEEWERDLQPARYAGEGRWNALGIEGTTDWPVRAVVSKLEAPTSWK